MKLFIEQRVFSLKSKFDIRGEDGEPRFHAEGEFISLGRKLHVTDMSGREVIYIAQRLLTFLPKYEVTLLNYPPFEMRKEFTFFRHEYKVPELGISIHGDFLAHEYTVEQNDRVLATLSKEWLTWGDTYVLNIPDPANELLALSCILVIDCVMAANNN